MLSKTTTDYSEAEIVDLSEYLFFKIGDGRYWLNAYPCMDFLIRVGNDYKRILRDLDIYEKNLWLFNESLMFLEEGMKERAAVGRALIVEKNKLPLLVNHEDPITYFTVAWRLERNI